MGGERESSSEYLVTILNYSAIHFSCRIITEEMKSRMFNEHASYHIASGWESNFFNPGKSTLDVAPGDHANPSLCERLSDIQMLTMTLCMSHSESSALPNEKPWDGFL